MTILHAFDSLARKLPRHPLEIGNEGILAVSHVGIVLDAGIPGVLVDGFSRTILIEHQVIQGNDVLLVTFQVIHG
jgi:hypothetical protein